MLNNILENAEQISKRSVCESIKENTERLKVNYRLIKLDDNAPLPFTAEELQYKYEGIMTNEVLAGIGLR